MSHPDTTREYGENEIGTPRIEETVCAFCNEELPWEKPSTFEKVYVQNALNKMLGSHTKTQTVDGKKYHSKATQRYLDEQASQAKEL